MDDRRRIEELTEAVTTLAGAVEKVASSLCNFDATNQAQIARDTAKGSGVPDPAN